MDDELKQHLIGLEERFNERLRDMETRLLSEFWKWGRSADQRYRQDHETLAGIDSRLTTLEDRVTDIERRGLK